MTVFPHPKAPGIHAVLPRATGKSPSSTRYPDISYVFGVNFL